MIAAWARSFLKGARVRRLAPLVVLLLFVTGETVVAGGEIFVCPDSNGRKHFTNTPESVRCVPFQSGKSVSFPAVSKSKWGRHVARSGWPTGRSLAYDREITACAGRHQVDPALIRAVIRAESGFDRKAVSRRGAKGLMQLMPGTARELNVVDPFDPRQNIDGGTRYLRTMLDMFDGDVMLALAAYNAGPSLVKRIGTVPAIPETRYYVKRVLAYYEGYGRGQLADAFDRSQINVRNLVTIQ